MASISKRSNGRWFLRCVIPDGRRPTIALGTRSERQAVSVKLRIENIVAALETGQPLDPETSVWINGLKPKFRKRLERAGLLTKTAEPEQTNLGAFLDGYIALRADVKGSTATVYKHTRRCLIEYLGADKPLASVTPGDADQWRIWLAHDQELGENTIKRRCGIAKQFFRAAFRRRLIGENPFADMRGIAVQRNRERFYYVSQADAQKVLDACPDAQWRLLFALSRFGGLRCPSEHLALRWGDIDWERGRMTVRSPKTEHHEGKESRVVPIFPELHPYLEQAFDEAEPGTEFVITRYRDSNANLRTHLCRIIAKAGLKPWPKLFQNLRSTRQTELADEYPAHVVCSWIGNSVDVAREHYLQVTDEHFAKASGSGAREDAALHQRSSKPSQGDENADSATGAQSETIAPLAVENGVFLDDSPACGSMPDGHADCSLPTEWAVQDSNL